MSANLLTSYTLLSPEECQRRITMAARDTSQIVGYALSSQADVVDNGDSFEVQSKRGPAILIGTVSPNANGSVVHGRIVVPAQRFYRFAAGLVVLVSASLVGTSAYDLAFGTHRLLTRSRFEITGHPASIYDHFWVFLISPVMAFPMLAVLWPTARPVDAETVQTFRDFMERLFEAKQPVSEGND